MSLSDVQRQLYGKPNVERRNDLSGHTASGVHERDYRPQPIAIERDDTLRILEDFFIPRFTGIEFSYKDFALEMASHNPTSNNICHQRFDPESIRDAFIFLVDNNIVIKDAIIAESYSFDLNALNSLETSIIITMLRNESLRTIYNILKTKHNKSTIN
jgi:hypothetical protein